MVRFARAVGSNRKMLNDATPWSELKHSYSDRVIPTTNELKQVEKIRWKTKAVAVDAGENISVELGLSMHGRSPNPNNKRVKKNKSSSIDEPIPMSDDHGPAIVRFEGFPVRNEDAIRLKHLKKKLLAAKLPHREIKRTMQLERRRAEKALSREKKQVCFHCRQSGHMLTQCPNLNDTSFMLESGICFKCGSTEHQHTQCRVVRGDNYKFASCFICKQEGHIAKQCPDNPRGLYPEGGSCRVCGDVTHMKKDCPKFGKKKQDFEITLGTLNSSELEVLESHRRNGAAMTKSLSAKKKIIKM